MIDRARLRQLAEAATKGPWSASNGCVASESMRHSKTYSYADHSPDRLTVSRCGDTFVPRMGLPECAVAFANADYIAAAHPSVMIELLDALEKAERELAKRAT